MIPYWLNLTVGLGWITVIVAGTVHVILAAHAFPLWLALLIAGCFGLGFGVLFFLAVTR